MNTDFASQAQLVNVQAHMAQSKAYTDLSSLQGIKQQAQDDQQGALREVAKQFESIFLDMVLKSMRNANEAFAEEGVFNSQQSKLYRDMYDKQISLSMTEGSGLGMADMLVKQLGGFVDRFQSVEAAGEAGANSATINSRQQQGLQAYREFSKLNNN